jgi:hypothetical protein
MLASGAMNRQTVNLAAMFRNLSIILVILSLALLPGMVGLHASNGVEELESPFESGSERGKGKDKEPEEFELRTGHRPAGSRTRLPALDARPLPPLPPPAHRPARAATRPARIVGHGDGVSILAPLVC